MLALEDRRLLASFAVTNTNASGSGSLEAAIASAAGNNQANTITFQGSIWNTHQTITLGGVLLYLSDTGGTQTITGPAAGVTISAGGHSCVFDVYQGVTASLSGLTITDGTGFNRGSGITEGGGVYNNHGTVTLSNCTITGNSASIGGGVYNYYGKATLTNCTISDNSVAPYNLEYGAAGGIGGAVDSFGTVTLSNCTISGNSAVGSDAAGAGVVSDGTAILTDCTIIGNSASSGGGVVNFGSATITNCTISGNQASHGGGVYNSGTATLTRCTIAGNSTNQYGIGGGMDNVGTATLSDTIVAGNTGPSSAASDISGTVTGKNNLIGTGGSGGLINGQNGNIVLSNLTGLGLAPLAFYGGPTRTMALLPGSAAIGKGIAVSGVTTDQRGFPLNSPIDIGAFQTQPSTGKLVVNSTADGSGNQPGKLDLRGAVDLADVLTGAQTITFDPTVFATAQTILLTAGPLELSQTSGLQTITGPAARVTINGGGKSGVFQVDGGATATLSGLTITGGSAVNGGGVVNGGTATITNCTFSGNSANVGGGVANGGTVTITNCVISGNSANYDGGVDNIGTATITNCTISDNSASARGGGVDNTGGTAKLTNCTISGNSATSGGGLFNYGTTTLTGCTLSGNSASFGGGLNNFGGPYNGGTATLTNCTLSGNSATFGGGLYARAGTIKLTGCTVSGNTGFTGGGMFNTAYGSIMVNSCAISGNTANGTTGSGGGIFNEASLSVANSQFDADRSAVYFGGGLENYHGTVTLTACTFSGDTAIDGGGASNFGGSLTANGCTLSGNSASNGGGVYDVGPGTATLTNCTLSGNSATFGGGMQDAGDATLINCTIAGNSAGTSGGGIEAQGTLTVTFSTFSGNRATYGGAIDNNHGQYPVTVKDSILAGDSASFGPEFCNSVTSAGHNLVAETDSSSGWVSSDLTGTAAHPLNALLSAPGLYGGPTRTMALLPGSPAIGTGIAVSGVSTDQRGVTRPGTGVNIGAFQGQGFILTPVSGSTPQSAAIDTAFANPLAVQVTAKDPLEPVAGGVVAFAAPSSGATATLSGTTATIGANGVASVKATANNTAGTYHVTAAAAGAAAAASFTLTNTAAAGAAAPASFTIGAVRPGTLTAQSAAADAPGRPQRQGPRPDTGRHGHRVHRPRVGQRPPGSPGHLVRRGVAISASVDGPGDATTPRAPVDKGIGHDAIPDLNVPLTVNPARLSRKGVGPEGVGNQDP